MAPKVIRKNFSNFKGKDLRSSDLVRDLSYAIDLNNTVITKDTALVTRQGSKILGPEAQFLGQWTYSYGNTTTGATEEEILTLSDSLLKRRSNTFTVAYSGAASSVLFSLVLDVDDATFHCIIIADGTTLLDLDLGTGLEVTPADLDDLETAIDLIANFSATISGVDTIPAAFLPITVNEQLVGSSLVLPYYDWATVNATVSTPFGSYYGARGADPFEHASACDFQDCKFIATGYEYLQKYDGQTVYREGMHQATTPVAADSGGGTGPTGTYTYLDVFRQTDNRGNITEAKESSVSNSIAIVDNVMTVTVTNLLAGSGFNTNCALINGNQSGAGTTTGLTVTNTPHTLKVGDTATFVDHTPSPPAIVARVLTAVTNTTITWAAATAVNVLSGEAISNGLIHQIFRIKTGGIDYFLVAQIPNNSFAATTAYSDSKTDAQLGAQYLFPFKSHDLLTVKPKYVIVHDGVLVCSGAFDNPNTVYHGYIEDPESFPTASNSFDIASTIAGGISGLASDRENLIIGKQTSIFIGTGSLDTGVRVDALNEGAVGIACHNASADVGDGVMILSKRGWYLVRRGADLIEIGAPINNMFFNGPSSGPLKLQQKRSWGIYNEASEQYLCFIPRETGSTTNVYANTNSEVYVLDLTKDPLGQPRFAWHTWSGLNMGGGISVTSEALWWQSKRDDASLTVTGNLFQQSNTNTKHDFADHTEVIEFEFSPQWEDGGEPGKFKTIPRIKVYNLNTSVFQTEYDLTVTTEIDYQAGLRDSLLVFSFNQGGSAGGWGLFPWGLGSWGSNISRILRPKKLRNRKFYSLRFVFTHGALHERAVITGWEYELVMGYREELTS